MQMVINIGTNGNGVHHWCHLIHHHWHQWIAISTIFCRYWCKWQKFQVVLIYLPPDFFMQGLNIVLWLLQSSFSCQTLMYLNYQCNGSPYLNYF